MQHDVHSIIGINWGSSNLRAYLIDASGQMVDSLEAPAGVAGLDRDGMVAAADAIRQRWPAAGHVYAAGMIGSTVGWVDAGYVDCPAGVTDAARNLVTAHIGTLTMRIVPGMACVRTADGAPDVLRGEETELLGLLAGGGIEATSIVALPGTHTKWIELVDGRVHSFMTAMSGELFDRLASGGLLASVLEGPGDAGPAFAEGMRAAVRGGLGLGTLLFGVRARVVRGVLPRTESSAYLRGLLAGAEIADALALYPQLQQACVPLIGSAPVCRLYQAALAAMGIASRPVASADAVVRGFHALHQLAAS